MPLYNYICHGCNHISKIFSNEELFCEECGSEEVEKTLSVPQKAKNTVKGDKLHNVSTEPNIREILLERSRKHSLDTMKDTIDKHGVQIAREKGWVDKKGNVRKYLDEK